MPQSDLGVIDPNETSGVELASMLTNLNSALRSSHRGSSRPSYAERGTMWLRDTGTANLDLFMFDGVDDILIGTLNATTNQFVVSGQNISLAGLGGVPVTRRVEGWGSIVGGGFLDGNVVLSLQNDGAAPAPNHYYGTNPSGTRGWWPASSLGGTGGGRIWYQVYGTPGSYLVTAPPNCTRMMATLFGGGAGGLITYTENTFEGGSTYTQNFQVSGAGAKVMGVIPVTPGQLYSVQVGNAGATAERPPGNWDYYRGGTGGDTFVSSDLGVGTLRANGGTGIDTGGNGRSDGSWFIHPNVQGDICAEQFVGQGGYVYGAPGNNGFVRLMAVF